MLRPAGVGGHKRQINLRLNRRGQLDLGLLGGVSQPLQRHLVALGGEIQPLLLLEFGNQPLHNPLVEVIAAQVRVAVGGFDLDDALAHFQNRNVKGAAAKVVHGNGLVLLLVQPVSQSGRRRLVHNALHAQPGNLARILGGLPLRVVEVRRNGDHRLGDRLAQVGFGGGLQLLQNHRRNLLRGVFLALRHHAHMVTLLNHLEGHHLHLVVDLVVTAAHEALDGVNGVFRVGNGLPLGHLTHQPLAALGEGDHGRSGARAFLVGDDFGFAAFQHSDARIRGSQIDSDNLSHGNPAFERISDSSRMSD